MPALTDAHLDNLYFNSMSQILQQRQCGAVEMEDIFLICKLPIMSSQVSPILSLRQSWNEMGISSAHFQETYTLNNNNTVFSKNLHSEQ